MTPRHKYIRDRIFQAFQDISVIKSDGNIKRGAQEISLVAAENAVIHDKHVTPEELAYRYEHPENPTTLSIANITWSRRIDKNALQRDFGVRHADALNQRQLWIVNAVIFDVTNAIILDEMKNNPADKNINQSVLSDTRAVLKRVNFSKMGMEVPLDNQPNSEFHETLSGKLENEIELLEKQIEQKKQRQGMFYKLLYGHNAEQDRLTIVSLEEALAKKRELLIPAEEKFPKPRFVKKG